MDSLTLEFGRQLNLLDVAQAAESNITMDGLTSAFSSYRLAAAEPPTHREMGPNSRHHQLVVDFPCFDLLPASAELALDRPCHIESRERPKKRAFFEHNHPDATVRLQTSKDVSHASIPRFQMVSHLESTIERLTIAPGYSTLRVISFKLNGHSQVLYRFQLVTDWVTSSGDALFAHETQNVLTNADEWGKICCHRKEVQWVKLLESHINRATEFSYLRVQERLEKHDARVVQYEPMQLEPLWDSRPLQSANNVLKLRMKKINTVYSDSELDVYRLPCGHHFMCHDTHLMCTMTEEQCKVQTCSNCNVQILNREIDGIRLFIVHDRRVREQYKVEQAWWKEVNSNFHHEVLDRPCESFHLPASAMPHEMNFVNYPETTFIRDKLQMNLADDYQTMKVDRENTMGLLITFATEALKQHTGVAAAADIWTVLPPRYRGFLLAWFSRTLSRAYDKTRKEKLQIEGSGYLRMSENPVTRDDDEIRLGYKLDVGVLGKRRGDVAASHGTSAVGLETILGTPYIPARGDWVKPEPPLYGYEREQGL